jgi:hypothetical protein
LVPSVLPPGIARIIGSSCSSGSRNGLKEPQPFPEPKCYHQAVENRTEPKTVGQWIRYLVVALIALFLVWWMLRLYVM